MQAVHSLQYSARFQWLLVLMWASLIFTLSHQSYLPGPPQPLYNFFFKKLAHITVYATLYWLILTALTTSYPRSKHMWIISFFLTILYAMTDEYHQSFIPGRTATLRDIGFDTTGAVIAFLRWYRYI